MTHFITKEMLFDHFAGRSTALQRTSIAEWLQQPDSQIQYVAWLDEWERQHLQYAANDERGLHTLLQRIEAWEQEQPTVSAVFEPTTRSFWSIYPRWLVAASMAVCLFVAAYAGRQQLFYKTEATTYGETRQLTLPDGSEVTLNANSTLRIPLFGFGDKTRTVWLTGEAAFSIRHTPTHQRFMVHTGRGVEVVVLGTEFNVYDRPAGTKVVLSKGAIQLNYHSPASPAHRLRLKPGDAVNVTPQGRLTTSYTTQPAISTAWRDHRFVFNSTPVHDIIDLLRDTYNLQVVLKDQALGDRRVTGSFQANNADDFLQVVAELLEINYKQKDDIVTFFE